MTGARAMRVGAVGLILAAALSATEASAQTAEGEADAAVEADPPRSWTDGLTLSGGATLASQYRFRGISLSDEHPAAQGALTLNHDSGAYAGVWGSTVDADRRLGGADAEFDLYAGYAAAVASGVTLDAGLLYYAYPGSKGGDFEFFEPYASLSGTLGPATAKASVAYAWGQDALGGNSNLYLSGALSGGIPNTPVTLKSHLGYSKGDTSLSAGKDYLDWLVGADFTRKNLTLGIAYVDTDLTGREAARAGVRRDIVDAGVVLSLSIAF